MPADPMTDTALVPVTLALDHIKALVLDSVPSPNSPRAYDHALTAFFAWHPVGGRRNPRTQPLFLGRENGQEKAPAIFSKPYSGVLILAVKAKPLRGAQ